MEIRINKGFSITFSIVLVLIILIGFPIVGIITNTIYPENGYSLTLHNTLLGNLPNFLTYLGRIVIGLWFFSRAQEFNLDKWTWLLIGLVFGQYSLVLFGINLISQSQVTSKNLFVSLKPILILLILTCIIPVLSNQLTSLYMIRTENSYFYAFMTNYNTYLTLAIFGIGFIINVIFARMLDSWFGEFRIEGKVIWIIATLFLGILPVILFKEILIMSRNEN